MSKQFQKTIKYKLIFLLVLTVFSCKHELEKPNWDIDLIVPIANTTININSIVKDSIISINENDSGLISLIYEENIIDLNLDSIININSIIGEQTEKLDSINFKDIVIQDTSTIGELIVQIPFGTILFPNGSTEEIPALPNVISNDTTFFDASEYFETMTLYDGDLSVTITNNFPTDISNISFTLINQSNQNIIASFYFPIISSGNSVSQNVSIAGQTIDKNIVAILNNLDVDQSNGPVTINYLDAIITQIKIENIGITQATAFFPDQELSQTLTENIFDFKGAQIKEIGIKKGLVIVNILSTLPDTGRIIYNIPSLSKNGILFTTENIVPPSINGEMTQYAFNFDGYKLDLTGQENRIGGDTINTIYTEFYTFIDSTGELITIDNSDSLYFFTEFKVTPEYALGFLGYDTLKINNENTEINVFSNIMNGDLDLKAVDLNLSINNYVGASAEITFNDLSSENTNTNTLILAGIDQNSGLNIINTPYTLNNATLLNGWLPIQPSTTNISLKADELLEIFPNRINTSADIYLNHNTNPSLDGFLFTDFTFNAFLNIEVPLTLIANDITLVDTVDFNYNENNSYIIEKLYLNVENGYPLDANVKLILLDSNDDVIDTLFNPSYITSAMLNENYIVYEPSNTILESNQIDINNINSVIFYVAFSTASVNEFISIYSSYNIDFVLSAKLKLTIGE